MPILLHYYPVEDELAEVISESYKEEVPQSSIPQSSIESNKTVNIRQKCVNCAKMLF